MDAQLQIFMGILMACAVFCVLLVSFGTIVYTVRRIIDHRISQAEQRKASRRLLWRKSKRVLSAIVSRIASLRPEKKNPDFSLWENSPEYRVALAHHCRRVGRSRKTRLYISDYPNGISTGYVKRDRARTDIDFSVSTGPDGYDQLEEAARLLAA